MIENVETYKKTNRHIFLITEDKPSIGPFFKNIIFKWGEIRFPSIFPTHHKYIKRFRSISINKNFDSN